MGREYVSTADQLKEQLRAVDARRLNVESELQASLQALPSEPGMDGPLVDREGFPRADVDVALVRQLRQKIIRLRNDEEALTKELDELLQAYFAASASTSKARSGGEASTSSSAAVQEKQRQAASQVPPGSRAAKRPFAVVDQVASGSPASQGGLQPGDRILQFGHAGDNLTTLAKQVQEGEGQHLDVEVLRRGDLVKLQITPSRWSGRGLLGANFNPL